MSETPDIASNATENKTAQPNSDRPLVWIALLALFFAVWVAYRFYHQWEGADRQRAAQEQSLTVSLQLQQEHNLGLQQKLAEVDNQLVKRQQDTIAKYKQLTHAHETANRLLTQQNAGLKKQNKVLDSVLLDKNRDIFKLKRQVEEKSFKR